MPGWLRSAPSTFSFVLRVWARLRVLEEASFKGLHPLRLHPLQSPDPEQLLPTEQAPHLREGEPQVLSNALVSRCLPSSQHLQAGGAFWECNKQGHPKPDPALFLNNRTLALFQRGLPQSIPRLPVAKLKTEKSQ